MDGSPIHMLKICYDDIDADAEQEDIVGAGAKTPLADDADVYVDGTELMTMMVGHTYAWLGAIASVFTKCDYEIFIYQTAFLKVAKS